MTRCLGLNCPVQEQCRRYTPHNGVGAKDFEYVPKVGCNEFLYKPYSVEYLETLEEKDTDVRNSDNMVSIAADKIHNFC